MITMTKTIFINDQYVEIVSKLRTHLKLSEEDAYAFLIEVALGFIANTYADNNMELDEKWVSNRTNGLQGLKNKFSEDKLNNLLTALY